MEEEGPKVERDKNIESAYYSVTLYCTHVV